MGKIHTQLGEGHPKSGRVHLKSKKSSTLCAERDYLKIATIHSKFVQVYWKVCKIDSEFRRFLSSICKGLF